MDKLSLMSTRAESNVHKALKLLVSRKLEKHNYIIQKSIEKYICNRFADVYMKCTNQQEIVVEIQNSKISVKELKSRTKDYNKLGIYVLWILHGQGSCVASPKYSYSRKEVKISPAESFLHRMYGGRVYYVNLIQSKNELSITNPFAIHYSKLLKKKKQGMFKYRYHTFFYRSSNVIDIPSWKLLCTQFFGYKIARFYDKHIKNILKKEILKFISSNSDFLIKKKNQIKTISKQFKKKYNEYLIISSLLELINDNKIPADHKFVIKLQKKLS